MNLGVLGGVGFVAYNNWGAPRWDRRVVSAVAVGLMTLFSGEGSVSSRMFKIIGLTYVFIQGSRRAVQETTLTYLSPNDHWVFGRFFTNTLRIID